jgi:hypothetical protein
MLRERRTQTCAVRFGVGGLIAVVLVLALGRLTPAQDAASRPAGDNLQAQIDELLRRVPNAGQEEPWDEKAEARRIDPASAKLRELDAAEHLTSEQWVYVLAQKDVIHTRARWPESAPLMVRMRCPVWLGTCQITAQPLIPTGETVEAGTLTPSRCGNVIFNRVRAELCQEVGRLKSPARAVEFQCTVDVVPGSWRADRPRQRKSPEPKTVWMGVVKVPVQLVRAVDDVITPVRSEDVTKALRTALHVSADYSRYGTVTLGVFVELDRAVHESLRDIAFGFRVDLLRDGVLVHTLDIQPDPLDDENACACSSGYAWLKDVTRPADLPTSATADHWMFRIRGDGEVALRDWNRSKYWVGEFVLPFALVLGNGARPADFPEPTVADPGALKVLRRLGLLPPG